MESRAKSCKFVESRAKVMQTRWNRGRPGETSTWKWGSRRKGALRDLPEELLSTFWVGFREELKCGVAISAAIYRGAKWKQPKNSRKGRRVGHGQQGQKTAGGTAETPEKTAVLAVFPAAFRLFYQLLLAVLPAACPGRTRHLFFGCFLAVGTSVVAAEIARMVVWNSGCFFKAEPAEGQVSRVTSFPWQALCRGEVCQYC